MILRWRPSALDLVPPRLDRQQQRIQVSLDPVVLLPIFTFGNLSRSFSTNLSSTRVAFIGSIARKASSRSWTRLGWPNCGVNEKIVQPWTTTNCRGPCGNTTRKESWRRPSVPNAWSINFALHTICNALRHSQTTLPIQSMHKSGSVPHTHKHNCRSVLSLL